MNSAISAGKNIYSLSNIDLDYLSDIAALSFGNYTAALRSFLNIYYDIRIDPPVPLNQNSRENKEILVNLSESFVVPNPVGDCFSILNNNSPLLYCDVMIYSIDGKKVWDQYYEKASEVCIDNKIKSGIYILKIKQTKSKMEKAFKIIVN